MTSLTERALLGALVFFLATASLDECLTGRGNRCFFRVSSLAGYARPTTGFVESGLGDRGGRPIAGPGLRDTLAAVDVMTPMGRVRFDERGDPVSYERVILQIQDGRHVVVWPKERAQAAAH